MDWVLFNKATSNSGSGSTIAIGFEPISGTEYLPWPARYSDLETNQYGYGTPVSLITLVISSLVTTAPIPNLSSAAKIKALAFLLKLITNSIKH